MIAKKFLIRNGLRCLKHRYHCKSGEIDLIMTHKKQIVLVEVKYRSDINYPIETLVDTKKLTRIHHAFIFVKNHIMESNYRIDVICISAH